MKLEKTGPVFNSQGLIAEATEQATKNALDLALGLVRADTPVLSGDLQRGFEITNDSLINEIPYALFVEEGTRTRKGVGMVRQNMKQITAGLQKAVGIEVSRRLS